MKRAINFFHNDNKILSSYDETFFVKNRNGWEKVINTNVFKGIDNPDVTIGESGDYYIQYEKLGNYLLYSEDFTNTGWNNTNNVLNKDNYIIFPETSSTKIIPNSVYGEHSISTTWGNPYEVNMPYWCYSFYVLPDELKYFQIILSDFDETYGVIGNFSVTLNSRKRYVVEKDIKQFGTIPSGEVLSYDDECIGVIPNSDGSYRVFVSCKFKNAKSIKGKFKLLRNISGDITDEFVNANNTAGLFINAAQLSKGKTPITYIPSNGSQFLYKIFQQLWIKEENIWKELEPYNSIWYGNDIPENNYGENGDIYFIEPIIQVGEKVRFGKNTLFKCWKTNPDLTGNTYYTEYSDPSIDDLVYTYDEEPIVVGKVIEYTKSINYKPSQLVVEINGSSITLYKDHLKDKRFLTSEGIFYWNEDKQTYSYISISLNKPEKRNLKFNNSLYNKDLFMDAITFSTNLFNQSYSSRRDSRLGQHQIGVNGGGNYNCWDFNNLRKYY